MHLGFSAMFRRAKLSFALNLRPFSTAVRRCVEDEGDWVYSSEWWGHDSSHGRTVLRSLSDKGNGVVSVVARPSSRPHEVHWTGTEKWLQKRYTEVYPGDEHNGHFRVLGYQWRTLHFNDDTHQSAVKIMIADRESDPGTICFMQQANCLAVPYLKSMLSTGLASISGSNYDLSEAVFGKKIMNILCIGHGGGSLPLFLACKIKGAIVNIVEIDPVVISASVQEMGFPSFSLMTSRGERLCSKPNHIDEVLWKGIHERIFLYESDAERFILESNNLYDMVFVDAYDGEDIFPYKLWNPDSAFLGALGNQLHPEHGTVVVNLHSDFDLSKVNQYHSTFQPVLPMGNYVSRVCRAYKDVLLGSGSYSGFTFTVSAPWVCNTSLVVCRGLGNINSILKRDEVLNLLFSQSLKIDNVLDLPFSCLEYIKRGFTIFD